MAGRAVKSRSACRSSLWSANRRRRRRPAAGARKGGREPRRPGSELFDRLMTDEVNRFIGWAKRKRPMARQIRIGVISDTHGLLRPEALARLAGVERIVHAGDVGSPEVLEALRT